MAQEFGWSASVQVLTAPSSLFGRSFAANLQRRSGVQMQKR